MTYLVPDAHQYHFTEPLEEVWLLWVNLGEFSAEKAAVQRDSPQKGRLQRHCRLISPAVRTSASAE